MSKTNFDYNQIDTTIARGTTVLIGASLKPNQVENVKEDLSAGSGVIIHRACKTEPALTAKEIANATTTVCQYYVLTSHHVISGAFTEDKALYGIRTADGKVYGEQIQASQSQTQSNSYNYIAQIYSYKKPDQDYDLAILSFVSDVQYPIAAFGDPDKLQPKDIVYVSGWARPPNEKEKRIRQTFEGEFRQKFPLGEKQGNYTLGYTLRTKTGISGGPVFNGQGELIGIHGLGTGDQTENIGKDLTYAIDIKQFIKLIASSEMGKQQNFTLNLPQPLDPLALTFGKKYPESGDNMTAEERRNFVIADMLRDDPRRKSVEFLTLKYGCFAPYEGGAIGAGLSSGRGQFANDVNACISTFERGVQANVAAQREKLDQLKQQIESLAQKLSRP